MLGSSRYGLDTFQELRRRAQATDLVVAHGSSTLLASAVGLVGTHVPFVYLSIGDPTHWAADPLRRVRVGLFLRRAHRVVAICEAARASLIRHFRLDPEHVVVIPNGRSAKRFAPASLGARSSAQRHFELPVTGSSVVVGFVGALSREKRPDVAVRAIAQLPDVHLVLAGDGPQRAEIESLAARLAPGRVHFLGSVDRVEAVYAAVDAVLVTSDSEGVPGVLIEAGLCAVPVVATSVGWVDQVVVDGVTGVLVPPNRPDLIAQAVLRVAQQSEEMGRRAREHCVARFELDLVVDAWSALVADVAAENSGIRLRRQPGRT